VKSDLTPVPFPNGKGRLLDPSAARIVAYLNSFSLMRDLRQGRLALLRELQSATGEELSALLPSVLDRAFRGEL
jgi:hypothetical protein